MSSTIKTATSRTVRLVNFEQLKGFDLLTLGYQAVWFVLLVMFFDRIPRAPVFIFMNLILALVLITVVSYSIQTAIGECLRYFYLLFYIALFFAALHYLIPAIQSQSIDWQLIQMDYFMFGTHPTVWLEKWMHPFLTEILQLSYVSYYFIPILVGWYFYNRKNLFHLNVFLFAVSLGFYLSFLGYLLFPALGPRFYLAHLHTQPLAGLFLFNALQTTLNSLENIQYDAFPSGHTAIILITLYFTAQHARKLFYVILPVGSLLIFSTVYLRYHYVIDIICGFALAALVLIITHWAVRKFSGRFFKELPAKIL